MKLREVLGDSADKPLYIETIPRKGYRFVAPVSHPADTQNGGAPSRSTAGPEPAVWNTRDQAVLRKRSWKLPVLIAAAGLLVVPSALLFRQFVVGHPPQPPAMSQRQLTANPHDAPLTSGVISPDGKYLAYSDPTGLYLRNVDSGETISVPVPKDLDAMPESWFPDSVHLVVSHFNDLEKKPPSLWEISVVGGTPRKLADASLSARVSPDGSKIVFLRGKWNDEEIWLIDTDKNTTSRIVDGGGDHFGPIAWAPDGKRFACVRMPDRFSTVGLGQRIDVFDAMTGRGETILPDFRLGTAIAWPDKGRLIYALQEAPPNDGNFNLWSVHLDPRTGRPSGAATRITNDQTPIADISVTSNGKRLALLRRDFQTDVYLAEVLAQGKQLGPLRRFTLDDRNDLPSAWTPDSKAVLFVSNRDGPNHIFRQAVEATQADLLIGGKDNLGPPQLTPDGLSALYVVFPSSGKATDNSRLMRVSLSGGPSDLALEEPGIGGYKCARLPSTVCIYSRVDNGVQRFFSFDPAGGKLKELPAAKRRSDDGPGSAWSLSPDGRYLASPRSPGPYEPLGVRIFDLTTSKERQIAVPNVLLIMGLDWAPDSRSLWVGGYMGRRSGGTRSGIVRVDLAGHATTVLQGSSMAVWFAIPSPDGRRLAVLAHTDYSNVSLLENF
jgi:Tol biopolymer transport system component